MLFKAASSATTRTGTKRKEDLASGASAKSAVAMDGKKAKANPAKRSKSSIDFQSSLRILLHF